jgi:hypothetical protein
MIQEQESLSQATPSAYEFQTELAAMLYFLDGTSAAPIIPESSTVVLVYECGL